MKFIAILLFVLSSLTNSYAQTDSLPSAKKRVAPWFVERFRLTVGGFVPVNNTDVQVGIKGETEGTNIDFEKDLGFDKSQLTFLANFQWRMSRRSRLNLSYYNIPRSSTYTLQKDITFKDQTYHINSTVNSYFNTAIYQISYGYAILAKPNYELGVMIGTHLVGGKTGISLNGATAGVSTSDNFGFTAPLPDLGIWGGYAFSPRFAVNLDFDYLSLTIDNISGRILAYDLLFIYKLIKELDLSLGFSGLNFKVGDEREHVEGHFKWGYNGPSLGLTYSFGKHPWVHP